MKTTTIYKIVNEKGQVWCGYSKWLKHHTFSKQGCTYQSLSRLHNSVLSVPHPLPSDCKIVKSIVTESDEQIDNDSINVLQFKLFVYTEILNKITGNDDYYNEGRIYKELIKKSEKQGRFNDLKFIVYLKPDTNNFRRLYNSKENILAAREILKNIGISSKSITTYDGCFGFYNYDEALKAKLALNISSDVDIEKLRVKFNNSYKG